MYDVPSTTWIPVVKKKIILNFLDISYGIENRSLGIMK